MNFTKMGLVPPFQVIVIILVIVREMNGEASLLSLVTNPGSEVTIAYDPSIVCEKPAANMVQCRDCHEASICRPENGKLVQIGRLKCLQDSATPYCDPGSGLCTAVVPLKCQAKKFLCPSENGYYPDPTDCTVYHICSKNYDVPNTCPKNNVYDHRNQRCKLRRQVSDCVTFNCRNRNGQIVTYPLDDRIYAICINNEAMILGMCKPYERYDASESKCVRTCRRIENQKSDESCQKYFMCAEIAPNRFEYSEQLCGCDEGFDENEGKCSKSAPCLRESKNSCPPSADKPDNTGDNESDKETDKSNSNMGDSKDANKEAIGDAGKYVRVSRSVNSILYNRNIKILPLTVNDFENNNDNNNNK